jgi:chromosome segregation ATPase
MVVLRRQETWPDGRRRLRIRWGRLARFTVPVLVVAAGLFGAAVSAAILVGVWDKEAGRRHALEGKLATSQDRVKALTQESKRLERRLAASRATSARLERSAARLGTAAQALLRENTALVASASRLHDRSGSVERRAASVSRTAATLGNDLVAVLAYITSTSADSLDPSYLKAQLDYLRPAMANVRSAAEALGADAGSYGNAVEAFAGQAAAYTDALRALGGAQRAGSSR